MLTKDHLLAGAGPEIDEVVRDFNAAYYFSRFKGQLRRFETYWMGVPCLKAPTDLLSYQEIMFATRPELVIECGVFAGGSALFTYSIGQLMQPGGIEVLGIDITLSKMHEAVHTVAAHSGGKLSFFQGSSIAPDTMRHVVEKTAGKSRVMVLLDSDHTYDHVLAELELYHHLVAPGMFLVVEDTNIDGFCEHYGMVQYLDNGPARATREFLAAHPGMWEVNELAERHLLTFNPGGYLRRLPVGTEVSAFDTEGDPK